MTGIAIVRYGLVLLLLMWGAAKFTAFAAEHIRPLVEHSPLMFVVTLSYTNTIQSPQAEARFR